MKTTIIYYSATGNTEMIANSISEHLEDKGHDVTILAVEDASLQDAENTDLLILGSPAMGVEEIEEYDFRPFFEDLKPMLFDQDIILFGSYDWGEGEWLESWQEECEDENANVLMTFKAMLDPQDEDLERLYASLDDVL